MALTRSLFAMLLLSMLVIATATDYSSAPKPKVEEDPKPPKLETPKAPKYGDPKLPKVEKPEVPKYETPKLPKVEKPEVPKYEEPKKPKVQKPEVPRYDAPKPPKDEKPEPVYSKSYPQNIGIQGLVLCKSGFKSFPIKGAVARITCLAEDQYGYETAPFSILSCPTDAKGYFFATLSPSQLKNKWKLTECKAFLDYSPWESCKVPTDVNRGVSGHVLASYRSLNAKNTKLYSVGPFFYSSEPKSVPNAGY